ncbi:MAG: Z-ring formation inhibitor MciZ [Bacillus sp. (in: firmicutes)]
MKLYIGKNQLLVSGKARDIQHLLRESSHQYTYVSQWVNQEKTVVARTADKN